jgi:single-stranded-DNA-specific exonuclease
MRADVIERAAAMGIALIVSVDTGIRASEVVREARERGIDVIVTDHHLPDAELPPALAVLNPNRRDCGYPDKNLCGAGVAFKLVHALLATLGWPAGQAGARDEVVSETGGHRDRGRRGAAGGRESRDRQTRPGGLNQVQEPRLAGHPGAFRLMNGRSPSARQVAFQIAPRINAAGRMDDAQNVIRMFLTDDPEHARGWPPSFIRSIRSAATRKLKSCAWCWRNARACRSPTIRRVLVFSGLNWHRGVVGIVASRLVERFCRPVFVLSEEDGQAQGSGRSIAPFHLLDALESMPDLFTRFGGHRQARA